MYRTLALCIALGMLTGAPAILAAPDAGEQVRAAVIAFNAAYERNDLGEYFGFYADDATLVFDSGRVDLETYRKDWHQLVADGGAVESNAVTDIKLQVSPAGDAVIATYQLEVRTRLPDASVLTDHAYETDVWFHTDGQWRVAHVNYTIRASNDRDAHAAD